MTASRCKEPTFARHIHAALRSSLAPSKHSKVPSVALLLPHTIQKYSLSYCYITAVDRWGSVITLPPTALNTAHTRWLQNLSENGWTLMQVGSIPSWASNAEQSPQNQKVPPTNTLLIRT